MTISIVNGSGAYFLCSQRKIMFKKGSSSSTSSVKINGQTKAKTTTYSNGSSTSNYYMSRAEQDAYNYAQEQFAKGLKDINVFSPQILQELSDQVEAYKNSGIKQINEIYSPMLGKLQNNIASRFGNLDNSIFLDKLNQIEGKRAESVSALAQDITNRAQELKQNEIGGRYDYLNFLNDYQNQIYQNALNGANTGTNMANSAARYSAQNNNNSPVSQLGNQLTNMMMSSILGLGGIL